MATIAATVHRAYNFDKMPGPQASFTKTTEQYCQTCWIDVTFPSGTYVQADDASVSPATVIQNSLRDGKTITILGCMPVDHGDENGSIVHFDGQTGITIAANVITAAILQEDAATERTAGAMSTTWNRPIKLAVTFCRNID